VAAVGIDDVSGGLFVARPRGFGDDRRRYLILDRRPGLTEALCEGLCPSKGRLVVAGILFGRLDVVADTRLVILAGLPAVVLVFRVTTQAGAWPHLSAANIAAITIPDRRVILQKSERALGIVVGVAWIFVDSVLALVIEGIGSIQKVDQLFDGVARLSADAPYLFK
jgi:hypothetical protein